MKEKYQPASCQRIFAANISFQKLLFFNKASKSKKKKKKTTQKKKKLDTYQEIQKIHIFLIIVYC